MWNLATEVCKNLKSLNADFKYAYFKKEFTLCQEKNYLVFDKEKAVTFYEEPKDKDNET